MATRRRRAHTPADRWRLARAHPDRGTATAEFAVALPALVMLVTFALGAVDVVLDKVQCVDAARDAALTAARGGDGVPVGRSRAPAGATVTVTVTGTTVRAVVTMRATPLSLGTFEVTATSVATLEPGAPP